MYWNIKRDFSQSNANKLMKYVGYNSCKADWNFCKIERGPRVCRCGPADFVAQTKSTRSPCNQFAFQIIFLLIFDWFEWDFCCCRRTKKSFVDVAYPPILFFSIVWWPIYKYIKYLVAKTHWNGHILIGKGIKIALFLFLHVEAIYAYTNRIDSNSSRLSRNIVLLASTSTNTKYIAFYYYIEYINWLAIFGNTSHWKKAINTKQCQRINLLISANQFNGPFSFVEWRRNIRCQCRP